jgi:ferrochelatase
MATLRRHVMLLGHGTIDQPQDIPAFLSNIRRGRPSPPELVLEIERRFREIGGSPLLRIGRELASELSAALSLPVHLAMRFWHPFLKDVLREVATQGCDELVVVPLAPYSGALYASEVKRQSSELQRDGVPMPRLACAPSWGTEPRLIQAFAETLNRALAGLPEARRAAARVFFTAHSLPLSVIRQGDSYADEVCETAAAVSRRAGLVQDTRVVYQSQGASAEPWLGPDLHSSLRDAAADGVRDVVLCPIGFLSDHIEVLYDLDIEAKHWADDLSIALTRTASLNAGPALVGALSCVVAASANGETA